MDNLTGSRNITVTGEIRNETIYISNQKHIDFLGRTT